MRVHSILGDDKIYNIKTIRFQFWIRVLGVALAVIMIPLSEYTLHSTVFYGTAFVFTLYSLFIRFSYDLHGNALFQKTNLYVDVVVLTFLLALRGGLRSDFFLGYYLVLGYVLLLRDRKLLNRLSFWIVVNFCIVSIFFTEDTVFSWGRLIIRLVLMIGTMALLSFYSNMLLEEESLKIKASDLALKDGLTGLYNRHILAHLDDLLHASEGVFCVSMIDIDDFKWVNDTYGHQKGDEVLIALADVFNTHLTSEDLVIRYGGEEFLLIFKVEEDKDVLDQVEKLLKYFSKGHYSWLEKNTKLTFSAGAVKKTHEMTLEAAIEQADRLLYLAKADGKNKVVSG